MDTRAACAWEPLVLQVGSLENTADPDWQELQIVGTCLDITKHYLASPVLLTHPTVRPVPVSAQREGSASVPGRPGQGRGGNGRGLGAPRGTDLELALGRRVREVGPVSGLHPY